MWTIACSLALAAEPRREVELRPGERIPIPTIRIPSGAWATDESVAVVLPLGPPLAVQARHVGTTDLLILYGDGSYELVDLRVSWEHRPGRPVIEVPLGKAVELELPAAPTAIYVGSPEIAAVSKGP